MALCLTVVGGVAGGAAGGSRGGLGQDRIPRWAHFAVQVIPALLCGLEQARERVDAKVPDVQP